MALHQTLGQNYQYMYQIQALQQHRLPVFGTGIFKSESWNDSLGSKDNGISSIKRKKFLLSESMSLSRLSGSRLQDDENDDNNHDDWIDELEMTTTEEETTSLSYDNGKRSLPEPIHISFEDLSLRVLSKMIVPRLILLLNIEVIVSRYANSKNFNQQFISTDDIV